MTHKLEHKMNEKVIEFIDKRIKERKISLDNCRSQGMNGLADDYRKLIQELNAVKDFIKENSKVEEQDAKRVLEKFTIEEEKFIWWGVQWAFKEENKNRIFTKDEFFNYIYREMEL